VQTGSRILAAAWLTLTPLAASGQESTADDAPAPSGSAPAERSLGLDRLLNPKPHGPAPAANARPGGKDRETWQREFQGAHAEVEQLRASVEASQRKMREVAGDANYSYSPAGGGETYDPEVLKLRGKIQRDRTSLEAAERRLRDLKVEASLAGVPEDWQQPAAP
jgi:hypothetical protein